MSSGGRERRKRIRGTSLRTTVAEIVIVPIVGSVVTMVVLGYKGRAIAVDSVVCTFWAEHCVELWM